VEEVTGKLAVVTGGGSGMGRELVRQLAAQGCSVATCDVSAVTLAETHSLAEVEASDGATVTTFVADVSDEAQMLAFRDHVVAAHGADHLDLLFNNAGIGGGGSMVTDPREEWDRTFAVCWGGVYYGTRTFLPLLIAAPSAHLVNTSSVNGFWASLGPNVPHTAYSAAKFAVKGFTEALRVDLAVNAPHVQAHVVMPGHIGTSIIFNSSLVHGRDLKQLDEEQVAQAREAIAKRGFDTSGASDEDIRNLMVMQAQMFQDLAPMSAAQAATVILEAVRSGEWRILVGDDAVIIDELVRESPKEVYDPGFLARLQAQGLFTFVPPPAQ
jgi:NAD(P)-dependent dehydrogenase (short-subunit alcohol dehydrogenase family)